MTRDFFVLVALTAAMTGCSLTCGAPPPEPPTDDVVGTIRVVVEGSSATLSVAGLEAPLRAVQVDVAVSNGKASSATGAGPWDVVEAGLGASSTNPDGGPKDHFTLVVGDTRRLPVNDGPLARLAVDDGAAVTLSNAFAVDANGKKRTITVVAR